MVNNVEQRMPNNVEHLRMGNIALPAGGVTLNITITDCTIEVSNSVDSRTIYNLNNNNLNFGQVGYDGYDSDDGVDGYDSDDVDDGVDGDDVDF